MTAPVSTTPSMRARRMSDSAARPRSNGARPPAFFGSASIPISPDAPPPGRNPPGPAATNPVP